jgi:FkbM family methyltransferase
VKITTESDVSFTRRVRRRGRYTAAKVLQRYGYQFGPIPEKNWGAWHERVTNVDRLRLLKAFDIDLVIDVGANTGQYGSAIRSSGYRCPIVSFEPLEACLGPLRSMAEAAGDWQVFPVAVGSAEGELEINVAGNSVSSSLLPMLDSHRAAAPESAYIAKQKVAVRPLDAAIGESRWSDRQRMWTKIDTQGFEWPVVEGASAVLERTSVLEMELSFVPLYEGQRLFGELVPDLESRGFFLASMHEVFSDPVTGKLLQVDGLFVRSGASRKGSIAK